MASIIINGIPMEVPDNKNILDVALEAGIYIPHLCHHPDLKAAGSCRMCIVEVEGTEGVVTSCNLKPKDGMKIQTDSDEIQRLRMLALELLLAGHPEECTSCPKYGNCELQMLIQYIGPKTGRLHMRSKGFKVEEANPMLVHDMNRCVLCGRCVRACHDLRGVKVLHYKKKDMDAYVGTLHDQLLTEESCRFCGACAEVCPTGTIRDKKQALESGLKKEDSVVACRYRCPAHTDVPRYVRLAKEGRFEEAAAVIREKVPFPKILGYICNHVCELDCHRGEVNRSVSIRDIKRFVSEKDSGRYWRGKGKQLADTGKKVCIIGAGPAGLSAAYYLRKQGHSVMIKEALPEAGGMMRYGIPAYRLPRAIIDEEVAVVKAAGVQMETGTRVARPVELLAEFDAVLMAGGGHRGVRLPIEGNDLKGVLVNTDFLRQASLGESTGIGKRVMVLGGGNVAFDCARTAKRLGAQWVGLACLESRDAMPADKEELEQAEEEGIAVYPGRTFERICGESSVVGVDFMKVAQFAFDENRRPVIEKEEDSLHHLEADTVIFAVGQTPDMVPESGLELNRTYIRIFEGENGTSVKGIFAAGDVVYGTHSVVKAIASGKTAASEIDRYLGGDGDISETLAPVSEKPDYIGRIEDFAHQQRREPVIKAAALRKDNFQLVNHGLEDESACLEAGRCLQCDLRLKISPPRPWGDFARKKEGELK